MKMCLTCSSKSSPSTFLFLFLSLCSVHILSIALSSTSSSRSISFIHFAQKCILFLIPCFCWRALFLYLDLPHSIFFFLTCLLLFLVCPSVSLHLQFHSPPPPHSRLTFSVCLSHSYFCLQPYSSSVCHFSFSSLPLPSHISLPLSSSISLHFLTNSFLFYFLLLFCSHPFLLFLSFSSCLLLSSYICDEALNGKTPITLHQKINSVPIKPVCFNGRATGTCGGVVLLTVNTHTVTTETQCHNPVQDVLEHWVSSMGELVRNTLQGIIQIYIYRYCIYTEACRHSLVRFMWTHTHTHKHTLKEKHWLDYSSTVDRMRLWEN